ncbi:complex I NDUFA9 subunit family protein [Kordiimonas lacus]|uniref:NADH dehydrogenase n=1 Tax=Kordiimonas lacus TaxID=637679 RepID=A0A1G6TUZ5_9PROT|nr:complex I NDUFA9 subunit family protein [Kordiimonas lacus]SDD32903.1 NADH dehydrogenase [Kordiimonas lacus]
MKERLVTVFGGSGFIGRYIVEQLAREGAQVRVAVRRPNEALFLKPLGDLGQIKLMAANLKNEPSVRRAVRGADAVINLVGILFNSGGQTFEALQAEGAGLVARVAAEEGVKNMVHMSALGATHASDSRYARTKAMGEDAVLAAFPTATILRPSVVIGPEDGFYNRFAKLVKLLPVLPIPGADTKFQPVYVDDVAKAAVMASHGGLTSGDRAFEGKTFELGGPRVMSLRALLEDMMDRIGTRRPIIRVPWGLAMLQATFLQMLPNPPLTRDQVTLLRSDNVVSEGALGFEAFGIKPTGIAGVLPRYSQQYRPKGQFKAS